MLINVKAPSSREEGAFILELLTEIVLVTRECGQNLVPLCDY